MLVIKPRCYILVGVPGSGKSTWAKQAIAESLPIGYASTDDWIEHVAIKNGTTYDIEFKDNMPEAVTHMLNKVQSYIDNNTTFIWDQTSVNIKSRRKKLIMIPDTYDKIAVVFPTQNEYEMHRRLNNREGKTIPPHVIKSMTESFIMPTPDEGFAQIWRIK